MEASALQHGNSSFLIHILTISCRSLKIRKKWDSSIVTFQNEYTKPARTFVFKFQVEKIKKNNINSALHFDNLPKFKE